MISPSHPGAQQPGPSPATLPPVAVPVAPRFVPARPDAFVQPTQGLQLDLRKGDVRARPPVAFADSWAPPSVPANQEPRPGQAVADRYVIHARIRALGNATLYRAVDMDLGTDVLLLVELEGLSGVGGGRREIRASAAPEHCALARQLEVGSWDGLRFASFDAIDGQPLNSLPLPAAGRLPGLHVATLASGALSGLAALHADGRLLGGVYPGSILVNPWGLDVHLVGWGTRADARRLSDRASSELRSLGRVLLRLRGAALDHPAERELDELLGLIASNESLVEGMHTGLVAHALSTVVDRLRWG